MLSFLNQMATYLMWKGCFRFCKCYWYLELLGNLWTRCAWRTWAIQSILENVVQQTKKLLHHSILPSEAKWSTRTKGRAQKSTSLHMSSRLERLCLKSSWPLTSCLYSRPSTSRSLTLAWIRINLKECESKSQGQGLATGLAVNLHKWTKAGTTFGNEMPCFAIPMPSSGNQEMRDSIRYPLSSHKHS